MLNLIAPMALAVVLSDGSLASDPPRPSCHDDRRACLESVARSYIAALIAHDGRNLPLADNVRRSENALTNARGADEVRESFIRTDMVKGARDVRLVVDPEQREVVAFFLLDVELKGSDGGGATSTRAGNSNYQVAVTKSAGTYTVHEAERFKIHHGLIQEIEIIAHVEDGAGQGSGWPIERLKLNGDAR